MRRRNPQRGWLALAWLGVTFVLLQLCASVVLDYTVTTTCANDGYTGTKLQWCQNICEKGYTGSTLESWIHRWTNRYRDLPYCLVNPQPSLR